MQHYNPLPSRLEVLCVVIPMTRERLAKETDNRIIRMLKDTLRSQLFELATIKANKQFSKNFNPQWN